MKKRLLGLALCLVPAAAFSGPAVLLSTTLFAFPSGGSEQYAGFALESGGANDGRGSILYLDASDGLHLLRYSSGGAVTPEVTLDTSQVDTSGGNNTGLALDASGNILVSAKLHSNSNDDMGVMAFSQSGAMLWSTALIMSGDDVPLTGQLGTDSSGNAYLAGNSGGYSGPGRTTWVTRINAGVIAWSRSQPASEGDNTPSAILGNPSGGAYLASWAYDGFGTSTAYLTAYDASGSVLWTRSFTFDSCGGTNVPALALANGYLYTVAGNYSFQLCVAKIDPSNGNTVAQGTIPLGFPNSFTVSSLVVQTGGLVIVGGRLWNGSRSIGAAVGVLGNLSGTVWAQTDDLGVDEGTYNPSGMGLDAAGNAYLAGGTGGSGNTDCGNAAGDVVIHKFANPNGTVSWSHDYDGPFVGQASGAVSESGSTFVATRDNPITIIKYDTSGTTPVPVWTRSYTSPTYCPDGGGGGFGGGGTLALGGAPGNRKIYLAVKVRTSTTCPCPTFDKFVVARYSAATGVFEHEEVIDPIYDTEGITGLVANASGEVWLQAISKTVTGRVMFVAKIDGTGFLWSTTVGTPANNFDSASGMAVDGSGNAYSQQPGDVGGGKIGILVYKFNTGGALQWTLTLGGSGNFTYPTGMAASSGTIYSTGIAVDDFNNPGYWHGLIIGFDPNGATTFTRTSDGAQQQVLYTGVAVDPSTGMVLAAGEVSATVLLSGGGQGGPNTAGGADSLVQAFDPTDTCGSPAWSLQWDSGQGDDSAKFITFPSAGKIVTVGTVQSTFSMLTMTPGFSSSAMVAAGLSISPNPADVGSVVTVTLTVSDTGGRDLLNGSATILVASGISATLLSPLLGQSPAPGYFGLVGGAGRTLRFSATVSGAATVILSATATGIDTCSGASATSYATGVFVTGYRANMAGAAWLAPKAMGLGDTTTMSLTVTNFGSGNALVTSTSATAFQGGALFTFVSPTVRGTGPLSSSQFGTMTWTLSATAVGVGTVSFQASWNDAVFGYAAPGNPSTFTVTVYDQARLTTAIQGGGGQHTASVGQWIPIQFTVSNTGSFAANNVSGTLFVGGAGSMQLISAPGSVTLAPHSSTVFTWTYSVSGAGAVFATMSATGTDASPLGYVVLSATTDSGTMQTPPALGGAATHYAPLTVEVGQSVFVTLTLSNTGQATALLNSASNKVYDLGTGTVSSPASISPPFSFTLTGGQMITYSLTVTALTPGTHYMTGSLTGIDANSGATIVSQSFPNSNILTIVSPPVLTGSVAAYGPSRNTGQAFLVTLTVTNTGGGTANGIAAPALWSPGGTGAASQTAGPFPAMPLASLAAGASQTFTWTFTGASAGTVLLTQTVTGTSALSGATVSSGTLTTNSVLIQTPAALGTAIAAYRSTANVAQTFMVTLTVTNTGGATANNVNPTTPYKSVGAGTTSVVGPTPAVGSAIGGGLFLTYTWTFTGVTSGGVVLTSSASGVDANTLAALSTPFLSATVTIQTPAALAATAYVSPAPLKQGQAFDLVVTITNTGQATADNVTRTGSYFALSSLTVLSGATPPGPFTLVGGGATTFTVSFQAVTPNVTVSFANTITGTDANTGAALSITGLRSQFINGSAILGGWLSVSNDTLAGGEGSLVSMTVTNGGSANAVTLAPVLNVVVSGTQYVDVVGPYPASVASLSKNGGVTTFSWTLTGRSRGTVYLTATIGGLNQPDSAAIAVAASATLSVQSSLNSSLAVVPAEVKEGQDFEVHFTVVNSDSVVGLSLVPLLFDVDPAVATLSGSTPSALPVDTLSGNSSKTFTWKLTAVKAGPISFTATTTADFGGPSLDATKATTSVTIKKAVDIPAFDGETLVYPNPVTGDLINLAVRLKSAMGKVELDVYNTGFQRVYHGEWPALPQGDSLLEITGAKAWAPGIYLARVTATKAGGGTQAFKTFRIAVKVRKGS